MILFFHLRDWKRWRQALNFLFPSSRAPRSRVALRARLNKRLLCRLFFGFIFALKGLRKAFLQQSVRTATIRADNFLTKVLETRKPCRLAYKRLVSKTCETPKLSQKKWLEDVGVGSTMIENNWRAAFLISNPSNVRKAQISDFFILSFYIVDYQQTTS